MQSLLVSILGACYATLLVGASLSESEENLVGSPYAIGGKPVSQNSYLQWLRLLLQQPRNEEAQMIPQKRFTDLSMPYVKYKVDKRNNGVWIWMPAQGYVSVPHQQEEGDNALGKPGKIMRYG